MRRRPHRIAIAVAASLVAVVSSNVSHASDPPGGRIRVSGFVNLTGAGRPGAHDESGGGLLSEIGVQVTPQWKTEHRVVIAARATLGGTGRIDGFGDAWTGSVGELSAFVIGPFGRIEVGERAGFPQTLLGYAPSEIAFTSAEYGPESGARLSPNGRLATAFLPPRLASRVDALSYLGYAARFYDSASPKITYVSPRENGFYVALSYAPRSTRNAGLTAGTTGERRARSPGVSVAPAASDFRDLVQAALVWQRRSESLDLTLGTTFSRAQEDLAGSLAGERRVDSIAGGVTAVLRDTWELGLSATYDGFSERLPGTTGARDPFGVVASVNWIGGAVFAGASYQYATALTVGGAPAGDRLHLAQLGVSYLVPSAHDWLGDGFYTDLKLYADATYTRFADGARAGRRREDAVLLVGARFSFY
jgi:hypothetical protein